MAASRKKPSSAPLRPAPTSSWPARPCTASRHPPTPSSHYAQSANSPSPQQRPASTTPHPNQPEGPLMRVHIATDHAGMELSSHLITTLSASGYEMVDHGPAAYDAEDDYPAFCIKAASAVVAD